MHEDLGVVCAILAHLEDTSWPSAKLRIGAGTIQAVVWPFSTWDLYCIDVSDGLRETYSGPSLTRAREAVHACRKPSKGKKGALEAC